MQLVSTRDRDKKQLSYTDVLLAGLADDGGLYVPVQYPQVSHVELEQMINADYIAVATNIKQKLIGGDIPDDVVERLVSQAYTQNKFPDTVSGNMTPIRSIGEGLFLQNLSLGPTAAFKDMAMQQLGQEMQYVLQQQDKHLNILGATSGDTGSAAEAALVGLERIQLFMTSPDVGMSDFQKAQMGSFSGGNIHNISIKGRFDDCQDMVKAIKADPEFSDLGAVNSINWGRISSQVPYYFSGYLQVITETGKQIGDEVDFCVPSGNFGNVLSGYIAKKMGLPTRRLIIATNENAVLDRLLQTGVYEQSTAKVTSSPSMDISKASNYERLIYDLLGQDGEKTARYMSEFNTNGRVDITGYGLSPQVFTDTGFYSGQSSHAQRLEIIKKLATEHDTIVDPHTADAVCVAHTFFDVAEEIPMVCLETALPVKFEHTITEALGEAPDRLERFQEIEQHLSDDNFILLDANTEQLMNYMRTTS